MSFRTLSLTLSLPWVGESHSVVIFRSKELTVKLRVLTSCVSQLFIPGLRT